MKGPLEQVQGRRLNLVIPRLNFGIPNLIWNL